MYKCYSDRYGNMPCDNGVVCDKCMYMDIEIRDNSEPEIWEEDTEETEEYNG